ncbi:MAG TPA: class I SAM-dependent methyltransferase [Blastocatellia bacterium]|nr:class I SAM-dependent methyltransferase [Blastocatellia bacterium]
MTASADIYQSARLAAGYAFHRPPVHPRIIAKLREQITKPFQCALDIGCGAGLSTAALAPIAAITVGLEPAATMLMHSMAVAPEAYFIIAQAEQLPFAAQSVDLLTAAGSLNYADLDRFFPEAARVLTDDGVLVIYDFSEARRLHNDHRLENWYNRFVTRFPAPPGYAMDMRTLAYSRYGFELSAYEEFEVAVPMTQQSYLQYAMSEARVERAILKGAAESDIRTWCSHTLADIFDTTPRAVLFDAYLALVKRAAEPREIPNEHDHPIAEGGR